MFEVIEKVATANISNLVNTIHNSNDRNTRTANIISILGGYGKAMYSFVVDTRYIRLLTMVLLLFKTIILKS